MSKDNVYKFRTVKWGDPEHKLKMIPDAIPAGLRPLYFALVTAGLCLASFGVIYGLRTLNVLWADLWWTHKGSKPWTSSGEGSGA